MNAEHLKPKLSLRSPNVLDKSCFGLQVGFGISNLVASTVNLTLIAATFVKVVYQL